MLTSLLFDPCFLSACRRSVSGFFAQLLSPVKSYHALPIIPCVPKTGTQKNRSQPSYGQPGRGCGAVEISVARITKRDQVLFCVISQLAPRSDVVNLKILQRPASLAAPTVALQDSLAACSVRIRIEPRIRAGISGSIWSTNPGRTDPSSGWLACNGSERPACVRASPMLNREVLLRFDNA